MSEKWEDLPFGTSIIVTGSGLNRRTLQVSLYYHLTLLSYRAWCQVYISGEKIFFRFFFLSEEEKSERRKAEYICAEP